MRWFGWFRKAEEVQPAEVLKPGMCECEHVRSSHVNGRGRCMVGYPPDAEWPDGAICACQIFILEKDSGGDDETPDVPTDPAVNELERMLEK